MKESELVQGRRKVVKGVIEREHAVLITPLDLESVKGGRKVIEGMVEGSRGDDEGVKKRRE